MTVGTLDENGLAVDEQLSTFDLNVAETHLLRYYLSDFLSLLQRQLQRVEVWRLGSPCLYVVDSGLQSCCHLFAFSIQQSGLYGAATFQADLHIEQTLALLPILTDDDVLDVHLRTGIEVDFACNTREAPEVLVLEP